ncbi:tellurite resistance TerB family protein [Flexibacterium corallicola]|uniref:tellurite resistance TerB family protein n=1 Tax=Flexibacterium corallicola TaxID=3037259 RepID=UPI00286F1E9C|nr:tellurite resistance TerB family protein [Pseudovibrio sp. M1P-2-3]
MSGSLTTHEALIHTMVMMSAADSSMTDAELLVMGDIVKILPVFKGFDRETLVRVAAQCGERMAADNGLTDTLDLIVSSLPKKLHDTAYALAVEVAAADLKLQQEELRMLELLRNKLSLDALTTAAIERSVQARYRMV